MTVQDRREFLRQLAIATGGVVVLPMTISCQGETNPKTSEGVEEGAVEVVEPVMAAVPLVLAADWDSVAFNTERGNAGGIPQGYLPDINGPDGVAKHMGKHLPYVPSVDKALVPEGYLAIMWGDPTKGHAMHPQAPKGTEVYPLGHWYNWIRVRKAIEGKALEVESGFTEWPGPSEGDIGLFVAADGGELMADGGKNTVYLVKLPDDVGPGDTVRIYGHCLYHGEYVDFVTV